MKQKHKTIENNFNLIFSPSLSSRFFKLQNQIFLHFHFSAIIIPHKRTQLGSYRVENRMSEKNNFPVEEESSRSLLVCNYGDFNDNKALLIQRLFLFHFQCESMEQKAVILDVVTVAGLESGWKLNTRHPRSICIPTSELCDGNNIPPLQARTGREI